MKNTFLLFLFLIFLSNTLPAQGYFARNVVIGSSIAPNWDAENDGFGNQLTYIEVSWEKNIAIRVHEYLYVGMNHINVYGKHISPPSFQQGKIRNFLFGGFAQFRLPLDHKFHLSADLGYYRGNHCTCIEVNPIQRPDLRYLNWAVGFDVQLYKRLFLDINFHVYYILEDLPNKYAYGSINLGLDYRFGKL